MSHQPLAGSEREPLPGAKAIGKANPEERLEVTIVLRRRAKHEFAQAVAAVAAGNRALRVSHEAFGAKYGALESDLQLVRAFAKRHGLAVAHEAAARRTVILSGTAAAFGAAFGVDLQVFEHDGGTYRGRTGAITLPEDLHAIVEAVLGLDNRPQAKPHFRVHRPHADGASHSTSAAAPTSFTPLQLAALYNFPEGGGAEQTIGLIELGGGYRPADLQTYFAGLTLPAAPLVTAVSVDDATNSPTGSQNGPDGEVCLDIEVAGAIAPQAKIVVYFAPNTDAGFLNAITTAVHDAVNKPSIISISWGGPESTWTKQAMTAFDEAFAAAATLGITVCIASGDDGSTDGVSDGKQHVNFPASSTYALACGGTSLRVAGGLISDEVVWNDLPSGGATGGGQSGFFPLPKWQAGLFATTAGGHRSALAKRGVPDVGADADPATGYDVLVDGAKATFGGTSAVAPLWAGLIARINARTGVSAGFINSQMYAAASGSGSARAFRDITEGNNGHFFAAPEWDACTGLGSPNGTALATILGAKPTASATAATGRDSAKPVAAETTAAESSGAQPEARPHREHAHTKERATSQ